jgi:hypothetical protein
MKWLVPVWVLVGVAACSSAHEPASPSSSSGEAGGRSHSGGGHGGAGGGGSGPLINVGFIGGPCEENADCAYEGGVCLRESEGFPSGMCSLDCETYCPDEAGFVTTFCVDRAELGLSGEPGLCTIHCDFGASPTGCRDGYHCAPTPRHGDDGTVVHACLPGEGDPIGLTPCQEELVARGVSFSLAANPMDHPEGQPDLLCDVEDPVYVSPVLGGVAYRPNGFDAEPATIFAGCALALALDDTAAVLADLGVSDVAHYGVYNCRVISGTATLSEHGHANAIDIAGVRTAEGEEFTVYDDFEKGQPHPVTEGGALLRTLAQRLYDENVFHIILTPDYNEAHADHFHCDLTPGSHFLSE